MATIQPAEPATVWRIDCEPVVCDGWPEAHVVRLHIGQQTFTLTPVPCETLEEAEWFKRQATHAILQIEVAAEERERDRIERGVFGP